MVIGTLQNIEVQMFSKLYSGKKVLERLTYITVDGVVIRVRNTGTKSNNRFQTLIDSGVLDMKGKVKLLKRKR